MARAWASGIELQSVGTGVEFDAITGSPTVNTTIKRSGVSSLRVNPSSATAFVTKAVRVSTLNPIYARVYLYIATAPTSGTTVLTISNSAVSASGGDLLLNSDRTLSLFAGGSQVGSSSPVLGTGQWYQVELYYSDEDANNTVTARLDGTQFASGNGVNMGGAATNITFGCVDTDTCDLYFDDIAANDNQGSTQNSWPGIGSIVHMQPDAAGDFDEVAGNFASVDEVTPDDGTTIAVFDVDSDRLDVNCESSTEAGIGASDTITLVQVGYRAAGVNTNSRSGQLRIKSQASGTMATSATMARGSDLYETNAPVPDATHAYAYKLTSYTDPQTGGSWTPKLLNSMQIGFQAIDAAPDINVSTLWALVEYVPTPPRQGFTDHGATYIV